MFLILESGLFFLSIFLNIVSIFIPLDNHAVGITLKSLYVIIQLNNLFLYNLCFFIIYVGDIL